ncbi:hypothetical protein LCGC14_1527410 [marine sediment metagenome]|uniref:Uncharacterized protein n=1 Tax=marine sediment metagenome TaxID=412755 RepID=A0A0F9LXU8_9ZZZZ
MTNIPECPKHKKPMKLIKEGLIMKSYYCIEGKCKKTADVITLVMKGQEKYNKIQRETEAKIKNRNIKSLYKETTY